MSDNKDSRQVILQLRLRPDPQGEVTILQQFGTQNAWVGDSSNSLVDPLLMRGEVEFEVAGAVYLGVKIRQIFFHRTTVQIIAAIDRIIQHNERYLPQFVNSYLRGADWDAEFDLLLERFQALRWGIDESNLITD